jgi:hypothetical protein
MADPMPGPERMAWTVTLLAGLVVVLQVAVAWIDSGSPGPCDASGPCITLAGNLLLMGAWPLLFASLFLGCLIAAVGLRIVASRQDA